MYLHTHSHRWPPHTVDNTLTRQTW